MNMNPGLLQLLLKYYPSNDWPAAVNGLLAQLLIALLLLAAIRSVLTKQFGLTASVAVSALKSLARRAEAALELPHKRPRLALMANAIELGVQYVFSLLAFSYFALGTMLAVWSQAPALRRSAGLAFVVALLVVSRWLFASAERGRIKFNERKRELYEPLPSTDSSRAAS
jgi:hypothetical protein